VIARLLSVNVGLPRDVAWQGKTVHTAIWKAPVQGRRMVHRLNIDGDGQGDLIGHGGEHRAVFVYQIDSYHYWQSRLGRSDFSYGQFGENFTVDGLSDSEVCIGDRYRIGDAVFEVTQPRVTCYRVGIRMNEPKMAALLVAPGRPGFYFRVVEEGEVEAGAEIVRVAGGPERMTVSKVNALLCMPGHPRSELERALRILGLSTGWRASFEALLEQDRSGGAASGNPGLAPAVGPPPAWSGFRPLLVSRKNRESCSVTSLMLEPTDRHPLIAALPGQFVVLRLRPAADASALLRSYSLSGEPSDARYRISVKRETHGAAGAYIDTQVRVGDVLDVSAPRGAFTLGLGDGPVILLSAGVGATPVRAMLHALVAAASPREVWWLHGARDGREHPFAAEARTLLNALPHSHSHIRYSSPRLTDRTAVDYDAPGRLSGHVLEELGVAARGRFLSMRTARLHERLYRRSRGLGCHRRPPSHGDFWVGSVQDPGRCCGSAPDAALAGRTGRHWTAGVVRAEQPRGFDGVQHSRAFSISPRGAMSRCDGLAGPASAIVVRPGSSSARFSTGPPGRAASQWQRADLLLPAAERYCDGSLTEAGSGGCDLRSVHGLWSGSLANRPFPCRLD
jgi:MOSC domain-containing protein YiiM/ferredoxin-NADP reductase